MLKKILISSFVVAITAVYGLDTDLYVLDKDGQKRELGNTNKEDMSIFVSNNITRKSLSSDITSCDEVINILKTDKYMHIDSDKFGPAPVELIVLDQDEKELYKTSQEAISYNFKVELKDLKNAKYVKVVNFFGDSQLCKKVIFK